MQFDGDGQHGAKYLDSMVAAMGSTGADMVIGSRFIDREGFQSSRLRRMGIRYFTLLIKVLTRKTITDPTSGMRLINRKLLEKFTEDYPRDYPEPESVMTMLSGHYQVTEVPAVMNEGGGSILYCSRKSVYYMIKVSCAILIAQMKW